MRRATLACASLLLLAGLTTACGGDDSNDDGKDDDTTSATPTDTSSSSESTSESPSEDTSESPSTSESPTTGETTGTGDNAAFCEAVEEANGATTIDDLRPAVDKLVENLPDAASDEAEDGLEFLQEELADAKDMDDFTKRVQGGDKEDMANTQEYSKFETTTCTGTGEDSAPSASASPS